MLTNAHRDSHDPSPAGDESLPWCRRYFVACWLTALLTHAGGLYQPMHSDFSLFLRIGREWSAGRALYGSAYDNKSPVVYRWARLVDSPWPAATLYLVETLLAATAATALARSLARYHAGFGVAVPVLLVAWTGGPTFLNGQTAETPAVWLGVLAVCAWLSALARPSACRAFLSGTALFLSAALYPPYLALLLVLAAAAIPWRGTRIVRMVLGLAAGFLAALGILLALAQCAGYLGDYLDVLAFNARYASLDRVPLRESFRLSAKTLKDLVSTDPFPVLFVCTGVALAVGRHPRATRTGRLLALSFSWLIAATVAVFPGGRHFPHYYHMLWAPLALLAGAGLLWAFGDREIPPCLPRVLAGAVAAVVVIQFANDAPHLAGRLLRLDTNRAVRVARAADCLARLAGPEESVAVLVWDEWAELYWRVPRPPAGGFAVPTMLPFIRPDYFRAWVRDVERHPPELFVVDRPMADWGADAPEVKDEFLRLGAFLDGNYTEIYRKDPLRILARRGGRYDWGGACDGPSGFPHAERR